MGALEAVSDATPAPRPTPPPIPAPVPVPAPKPGTTKIISIPAIWSADVFSDATIAVDSQWDHCAGRQGDVACRVILIFPTAGIPPAATIASVRLVIQVPYTSSKSPFTWAISRYGSLGDDPRVDKPAAAFMRADSKYHIQGATGLRTTGQKTILLNDSIADLINRRQTQQPLILSIKQNQENVPDRFAAVGRYQDAQARAVLLVTVRH